MLLKIINRRLKMLNALIKVAKSYVAMKAQKAAHLLSSVIVIYLKASTDRSRPVTNSTKVLLRFAHYFKLLNRNSKSSYQFAVTSNALSSIAFPIALSRSGIFVFLLFTNILIILLHIFSVAWLTARSKAATWFRLVKRECARGFDLVAAVAIGRLTHIRVYMPNRGLIPCKS